MTSATPRGRSRYVHALRFQVFNRFYDFVVRVLLRDRSLKSLLVQQADLQPGRRVLDLDLGCGTGTLVLMLKGSQPSAAVIGLDGDPDALARGRAKARAAEVRVVFREGIVPGLPFPPVSFDCVVTSLFLHHLSREGKRQTLVAARRLLRPGRKLHVADWGRPRNLLTGIGFLVVRLLDGFGNTADNAKGEIPKLMEEAGFVGVEETRTETTVLGSLSFWQGSAPLNR